MILEKVSNIILLSYKLDIAIICKSVVKSLCETTAKSDDVSGILLLSVKKFKQRLVQSVSFCHNFYSKGLLI